VQAQEPRPPPLLCRLPLAAGIPKPQAAARPAIALVGRGRHGGVGWQVVGECCPRNRSWRRRGGGGCELQRPRASRWRSTDRIHGGARTELGGRATVFCSVNGIVLLTGGSVSQVLGR
jgi:hypothetical protein